jgi:hypothetical protein
VREIIGNIWDVPCDIICVTTNLCINSKGEAIMGKGIALQAKEKDPSTAIVLGELLQHGIIRPNPIGSYNKKSIYSFPTKIDWRFKSSLELIHYSSLQLKEVWNYAPDNTTICITRPGCGNGGLSWDTVKNILKRHWGNIDEFIVVNND